MVKVSAHRVIFVDLTRAVAVLLMIQGHTIDALLAPAYRQGTFYNDWLFVRGLTSCLFLTLSGFAFSVATARHWESHLGLSAAFVRRVRRFGFFIVLGYALHFPTARVWNLSIAGESDWRAFLAVDVLQLIGSMLILLQCLVVLTRSRVRFAVATFSLTTVVVTLTPYVWAVEWTRWLPLAVASYASPRTGSLFPLFPWVAYALLGAALGHLYAHWGAAHLKTYENRILFAGGLVLLVAGLGFARLPYQPFGDTDFWKSSPNIFLIRAGCVLLVLAGMAHVSRYLGHLPHVFSALAQESLVIYFLHLCIVYGSVWNPGFRQWFGTTLPPAAVAVIVVMLLVSMSLLAGAWNWCKHAHVKAAQAIRAGIGAILIADLL